MTVSIVKIKPPIHPFIILCLVCLGLNGCGGGIASVAGNIAMTALGIRKDQGQPAAPIPPKNIVLEVHTANNLNADQEGHGLSAVLRIYKLKDSSAFNQASMETLSNPEITKQALGQDMIESKEP